MNDKKNNVQQSGEQNPTLNSPGAKVADYGNPTGGSANDTGDAEAGGNSRQTDDEADRGNNETMGNP